MKQFFEEVERSLVAGVSEEELAIFFKVMHQFYENMKKKGARNDQYISALNRQRMGHDCP